MFKVTNTAKGERSFWHTDPETGARKLARLGPGESGNFAINPDHSAFKGTDLEVSEAPAKKAKADKTAGATDALPPPNAD